MFLFSCQIGMCVCTKSFLKNNKFLVFAHTWRIKLILTQISVDFNLIGHAQQEVQLELKSEMRVRNFKQVFVKPTFIFCLDKLCSVYF